MTTTLEQEMAQLGRMMRAMRTATDLTQRETARRLGIAPSTLSHYERGRYVPPYVRHRFARVLADEALSRRQAA